jgi:hypothetical protein
MTTTKDKHITSSLNLTDPGLRRDDNMGSGTSGNKVPRCVAYISTVIPAKAGICLFKPEIL